MLHGFVRTPSPSPFESSPPHASGFDRMPRLCYIVADGLHLCYSCSLLSFPHHGFCGYFSCIFLPNLRILVPDRIVPFGQTLLASSCHDFSSSSFFFFFLAQLLFIFSFSIFLSFFTHSTIWKSMYLFSPLCFFSWSAKESP